MIVDLRVGDDITGNGDFTIVFNVARHTQVTGNGSRYPLVDVDMPVGADMAVTSGYFIHFYPVVGVQHKISDIQHLGDGCHSGGVPEACIGTVVDRQLDDIDAGPVRGKGGHRVG